MIIVGTAGHIDHGKTTLATTLTGVATDRLKEEKDRGISIELGFAHWTLDSGQRIALIDVPGHEKFVRQMIAGAIGVDLVMLVIAADEGIMPQTREHLDICRLLGIQEGVVVLTKVDLVDEDWLELVEEDIRDVTRGTFLENQPIWHFSPHREDLVKGLQQRLNAWVEAYPARRAPVELERPFKISADRVFTMKGFGTVLTGTVSSGRLEESDELVNVVAGNPYKVRGIQVHGQSENRVERGSRAAINLQGADKSELHRGDVLSRKGELVATSMIDVELTLVHSLEKTVQKRSKALVHLGTTQLVATVVLLGVEEASAGDHVFAQLRLEHPTVVLPGERLILRGFEVLANYGKTFAGGKVLDPHPLKHKGDTSSVVESLTAIGEGSIAEGVEEIVRLSGDREVDLLTLWRRVPASRETLRKVLADSVTGKQILSLGGPTGPWMHMEAAKSIHERLLKMLERYHADFPTRTGMPREEVRSRLRFGLDAEIMDGVLAPLVKARKLESLQDQFRLAGFAPKISAAVGENLAKMLKIYADAGLEPPLQSDCTALMGLDAGGVKEVMDVLVREGKLIHVKGPLFFEAGAVASLRAKLIAYLQEHKEITTLEFKDMTGASRKFAIPLAEYFDARKVTLRAGTAARRLRPGVSA